jgi:hypothetical protein
MYLKKEREREKDVRYGMKFKWFNIGFHERWEIS